MRTRKSWQITDRRALADFIQLTAKVVAIVQFPVQVVACVLLVAKVGAVVLPVAPVVIAFVFRTVHRGV